MEYGAVLDQFPFQVGGVYQIAVMGQGQRSFYVRNHKRLGVFRSGTAGGRITHMADAQIATDFFHIFFMEHFADKTCIFEALAVSDGTLCV